MNARPEISSLDKLPWPDLATAPLGTDEEAAGAPTAHKEIAEARSNAFGAQPIWFDACSFFVAVVVLIGAVVFVGALYI